MQWGSDQEHSHHTQTTSQAEEKLDNKSQHSMDEYEDGNFKKWCLQRIRDSVENIVTKFDIHALKKALAAEGITLHKPSELQKLNKPHSRSPTTFPGQINMTEKQAKFMNSFADNQPKLTQMESDYGVRAVVAEFKYYTARLTILNIGQDRTVDDQTDRYSSIRNQLKKHMQIMLESGRNALVYSKSQGDNLVLKKFKKNNKKGKAFSDQDSYRSCITTYCNHLLFSVVGITCKIKKRLEFDLIQDSEGYYFFLEKLDQIELESSNTYLPQVLDKLTVLAFLYSYQHGDLHSQNILFDPRINQIKLIDFDWSRPFDQPLLAYAQALSSNRKTPSEDQLNKILDRIWYDLSLKRLSQQLRTNKFSQTDSKPISISISTAQHKDQISHLLSKLLLFCQFLCHIETSQDETKCQNILKHNHQLITKYFYQLKDAIGALGASLEEKIKQIKESIEASKKQKNQLETRQKQLRNSGSHSDRSELNSQSQANSMYSDSIPIYKLTSTKAVKERNSKLKQKWQKQQEALQSIQNDNELLKKVLYSLQTIHPNTYRKNWISLQTILHGERDKQMEDQQTQSIKCDSDDQIDSNNYIEKLEEIAVTEFQDRIPLFLRVLNRGVPTIETVVDKQKRKYIDQRKQCNQQELTDEQIRKNLVPFIQRTLILNLLGYQNVYLRLCNQWQIENFKDSFKQGTSIYRKKMKQYIKQLLKNFDQDLISMINAKDRILSPISNTQQLTIITASIKNKKTNIEKILNQVESKLDEKQRKNCRKQNSAFQSVYPILKHCFNKQKNKELCQQERALVFDAEINFYLAGRVRFLSGQYVSKLWEDRIRPAYLQKGADVQDPNQRAKRNIIHHILIVSSIMPQHRLSSDACKQLDVGLTYAIQESQKLVMKLQLLKNREMDDSEQNESQDQKQGKQTNNNSKQADRRMILANENFINVYAQFVRFKWMLMVDQTLIYKKKPQYDSHPQFLRMIKQNDSFFSRIYIFLVQEFLKTKRIYYQIIRFESQGLRYNQLICVYAGLLSTSKNVLQGTFEYQHLVFTEKDRFRDSSWHSDGLFSPNVPLNFKGCHYFIENSVTMPERIANQAKRHGLNMSEKISDLTNQLERNLNYIKESTDKAFIDSFFEKNSYFIRTLMPVSDYINQWHQAEDKDKRTKIQKTIDIQKYLNCLQKLFSVLQKRNNQLGRTNDASILWTYHIILPRLHQFRELWKNDKASDLFQRLVSGYRNAIKFRTKSSGSINVNLFNQTVIDFSQNWFYIVFTEVVEPIFWAIAKKEKINQNDVIREFVHARDKQIAELSNLPKHSQSDQNTTGLQEPISKQKQREKYNKMWNFRMQLRILQHYCQKISEKMQTQKTAALIFRKKVEYDARLGVLCMRNEQILRQLMFPFKDYEPTLAAIIKMLHVLKTQDQSKPGYVSQRMNLYFLSIFLYYDGLFRREKDQKQTLFDLQKSIKKMVWFKRLTSQYFYKSFKHAQMLAQVEKDCNNTEYTPKQRMRKAASYLREHLEKDKKDDKTAGDSLKQQLRPDRDLTVRYEILVYWHLRFINNLQNQIYKLQYNLDDMTNLWPEAKKMLTVKKTKNKDDIRKSELSIRIDEIMMRKRALRQKVCRDYYLPKIPTQSYELINPDDKFINLGPRQKD